MDEMDTRAPAEQTDKNMRKAPVDGNPPFGFCANCGAALPAGARFCNRCGRFCAAGHVQNSAPMAAQRGVLPQPDRLNQGAGQGEQPRANVPLHAGKPAARKGRGKKAVLIAAACVAVVAVTFLLLFVQPFAKPDGSYYLIDAFEGWKYVARSGEPFAPEDVQGAGALSAYRTEAELTAWFADNGVSGSARYRSYRLALVALDSGKVDALLVPNTDVDELYRGGWQFETDYLVALEESAVDAAVHETLGKGADDPIRLSELQGIRALSLDNTGVGSLNDVDLMSGLAQLSAQGCGIEDLAPLASCGSLERLVLAENRIADIAPLAGLVQLTDVDLSGNEIVDFTPVAQWTELRALNVADNPADGELLSQAVRGFSDEVVNRTAQTAFETELPCMEYAVESICGIPTGYEFYTGNNDGQYDAPKVSDEVLTIRVGETVTLSLTAYASGGWNYFTNVMPVYDAPNYYNYVEVAWGEGTAGEGYGVSRLEITGTAVGDTAVFTYFSNSDETRASYIARTDIHVVA